jgi:hypothetical protein
MSASCPPLPTVNQLFTGEYYEVNIDDLVPEEIVIAYIENIPYMGCIQILENDVESGRIKTRPNLNNNSTATSFKPYLTSIGFRYFRKNERYNFDTVMDMYTKMNENSEKPTTPKEKALTNLNKEIASFLGKEMPKPKKGGTRTNRRKKTVKSAKKNTSNVVTKDKRKFISSSINKTKLSEIDENYNDITPENDSIVYFLILAHGSVNYIDYEPGYIYIPRNIEYFNKITYAPFGFNNFATDDSLMLNSITEKINTSYSENNEPIVENKLIEGLQEVDCVLKMQKEFIERSKHENSYPHIKARCGHKMIVNRENQLYQSAVYSKEKKDYDYEIINKSFSIEENDSKEMNIYVVFAKGQSGILQEGDTVLNSEKYIEYLGRSEKQMLEESKSIIEERGHEYDIETKLLKLKEKNKKMAKYITTEELLEFADFCNYKNVVIIDYSCDVCINDDGEKIPRDEVMKLRREKIDTKLVGRGSQKHTKKSKIRRFSKKQKNKL